MRYGTLVGGQPVHAPNPLHIGGSVTYNPQDALYEAAGYLPIVDTPMPATAEDAEPVYYTSHWEEQDGQIVRVWTETEPPAEEPAPAPEMTPAEQRERAYDTEPCVVWGGDMLTVTDAAQVWAYYAAEGRTDKTNMLTALIAAAKVEIRAKYPDSTGGE